MFNKRISIFTGHFGSGKTEVALNYALELAERGKRTAIVDFDIVNPFFRTADAKAILEEKGIWAVVPVYANTNVDVPALPPEISSVFEKKEYSVVLDVGGDDLGARVLSRYRDEIFQDDYEMFFVVNIMRPMTDTIEKIEQMIWEIEESARIKVTKLVNNTNLLQYTSEEDILKGQAMVEAISQKLGIPIAFISGLGIDGRSIEEKTGIKVLEMNRQIKLPWDI